MSRLERPLPFLILALAAVALVPSVLRPSLLPCYRDLLDFHYPMKVQLARALSQGELPFWDPWTLGGHPFLANLQSEVFYPPNWIFGLLPGPWALSLFLAAHLAWAGLGTHALARALGCSKQAALLAGVALTCGGFTVSLADMSNQLCAFSWSPWACAAAFSFGRTGSKRSLAAWTACCSLALLAAAPQIAVLAGMLSTAFVLVGARELGPAIRRGLSGALLVAILTACCCAVQLGPFIEFALRSDRVGSSWEGQQLSLSVAALPAMVDAPNEVFDNPAGLYVRSIYLGPLFVLCLALGLFRRDRLTLFLAGVAGLSFALATGTDLPLLGPALQSVTPFLRFPGKYATVGMVLLPLLAARGLDLARVAGENAWPTGVSRLKRLAWLVPLLCALDMVVANRVLTVALPAEELLATTEVHRMLQANTDPEKRRVHHVPPSQELLRRRAARALGSGGPVVPQLMRERVELLEGGLPAVFEIYSTWGGASLTERTHAELLDRARGPLTEKTRGELGAVFLLAPSDRGLPLPRLPFEGGAAALHALAPTETNAPLRVWDGPNRVTGPKSLPAPSTYPGWSEGPEGSWTFRPTGFLALAALSILTWASLGIVALRRASPNPDPVSPSEPGS